MNHIHDSTNQEQKTVLEGKEYFRSPAGNAKTLYNPRRDESADSKPRKWKGVLYLLKSNSTCKLTHTVSKPLLFKAHLDITDFKIFNEE